MSHDSPSNPQKQRAVPAQFRRGWLDELDGRLGLARDLRARFDEIAADLGGIERLSYAKRSLIERALWAEFWIAQQERELSRGGEIDVGRYTQAVNVLQGLFSRIGLDRVARTVTLHDYIRQRDASS
jgi:hypothetical protein